jgi:hypothetical protein
VRLLVAVDDEAFERAVFGDELVAATMIDRLVHHADVVSHRSPPVPASTSV